MNIDQARRIPISLLLSKMGKTQQRTKDHYQVYFSPFRTQNEPTLWVNTKSNRWFDMHDIVWKAGDGIHLVRAYLCSQKENFFDPDVLRWIRNMTDFIPRIRPVKVFEPEHNPKKYIIRDTGVINQQGLISFGKQYGIPASILTRYFKQIRYSKGNDENIFALYMKNESKGYEAINPFTSTTIRKKDIIFIRGTKPKPSGIHVFMKPFDFASIITQRNGDPLEDDALILTSLNLLDKGSAYIKNYGYEYCYTWMNNTRSGIEATKSWRDFCKTEEGLKHVPLNEAYLPLKNPNSAHLAKIQLA